MLSPNGANVIDFVYDTLLAWKIGPEVDYLQFDLEPALAKSWDLLDNGKTYVFHLREGVKWHDPKYGEFTARDVVFSLHRMRERVPDNSEWYRWDEIETVEKLDDYTVRVVLKHPYVGFLANLAHPLFGSMVSHRFLEEQGDLKKHAMGTGPFKYVSYAKDDKAVFVRNAHYWRKDQWGNQLPYLDELIIFIIVDYQARDTALRAGQIDLQTWVRWGQAEGLVQAMGQNAVYEKWLCNFAVGVYINCTKPPLNDPRVRLALSLATDRDGIAKSLGGGTGIPDGQLPLITGDYRIPPEKLPNWTLDYERAKKLLAEAGYPNGFTISIKGVRPIANRVTVAESMQRTFKNIGVELEIKLGELAAFIQDELAGHFDLAVENPPVADPDPDNALYGMYFTGSRLNFGKFSDPELDPLLEKQRRIFDTAERKKLVEEIQLKLTETVPFLYTGAPFYASIWWPYVKNYRYSHAAGVNRPVWQIWLDTDHPTFKKRA